VLTHVEQLQPGEGLPATWLAERYAEARRVPVTKWRKRSMRRAITSLEQKKLVGIDRGSKRWVDDEEYAELLVGRAGYRIRAVPVAPELVEDVAA
jgi:hypothetical protein